MGFHASLKWKENGARYRKDDEHLKTILLATEQPTRMTFAAPRDEEQPESTLDEDEEAERKASVRPEPEDTLPVDSSGTGSDCVRHSRAS